MRRDVPRRHVTEMARIGSPGQTRHGYQMFLAIVAIAMAAAVWMGAPTSRAGRSVLDLTGTDAPDGDRPPQTDE
jgi:hypothetical protein